MLRWEGPSSNGLTPVSARMEVDGRNYLRKGVPGLAAKRVFDVVVGLAGLLVALPLFAVIAVLIKLDSRGPVFFRQTRVGRFRRPFRMWKFRKMFEDLPAQGPSLTLRYDFRMTRIGRVLERTKLDELPQLLNVVSGDMSVIGPRPEVPKFVEHYPERWGDVLSVKPGIFGPNQIRNRNESELYPPGVSDVESFYVSHILPDKLKIDGDYARRAALHQDLWLLVRCLIVATCGSITGRSLKAMRQQAANFAVLSAAGIGCTAAVLALGGRTPSAATALQVLALAAIVKPLMLLMLRIPKSLALSVTADDLVRLVQCAMGSAAAIAVGLLLLGQSAIDPSTLVLDGALFLATMVVFKLALYALHVTFRVQESRILARRLVVAAALLGPACTLVALTLRHGLFSPLVLVLPLFIRPVMILVTRFPAPSAKWLSELAAYQLQLVPTTAAGSLLLALGARAISAPVIGTRDLVLDALLFHGALSAFVLVQRVRLAHLPGAGHEAAHESEGANGNGVNGTNGTNPAKAARGGRERILVAGSGLELAGYVSALDALPESRFEVVGIVTPQARDRFRTIGGHRILGELLELPEMLKTLRIQRLVVVPNGMPRTTLAFIQKSATDAGCHYLAAPILSGLVAKGVVNGQPSRNGTLPASNRLITRPITNEPRARS